MQAVRGGRGGGGAGERLVWFGTRWWVWEGGRRLAARGLDVPVCLFQGAGMPGLAKGMHAPLLWAVRGSKLWRMVRRAVMDVLGAT